MFVEVKEAVKEYGEGESLIRAMDGVNFGTEKGEITVILGPSGSGKSTLLNMIGGIDKLDSGTICIGDTVITGLKKNGLTDYRRKYVGFVFQSYNLIPDLTVRENIEVCEFLTKKPLEAKDLMETLGIAEIGDRFPAQLSGGQQQRVAIARALIKNPELLLCDEPTGALDSRTSRSILTLLETINNKYGTTMMIVTHNNAIRKMVDRVIIIKDGEISECSQNAVRVPAAELTDL